MKSPVFHLQFWPRLQGGQADSGLAARRPSRQKIQAHRGSGRQPPQPREDLSLRFTWECLSLPFLLGAKKPFTAPLPPPSICWSLGSRQTGVGPISL